MVPSCRDWRGRWSNSCTIMSICLRMYCICWRGQFFLDLRMSGSGTGDRLVTGNFLGSGAPSGPYSFRKDSRVPCRIRNQTVGSAHGRTFATGATGVWR